MKNYKDLEQLNKEWKKYGFCINEKGELLGTVNGKEYKCGKATFYDENGKQIEQERERETKNKSKK